MVVMVTKMEKSKMILIMKMKSMKKITKVKQNGRHVALMNLAVSHLIAVLKKMKKKQNRLKMRIKSTLTLNNQNKMTKRKILKKWKKKMVVVVVMLMKILMVAGNNSKKQRKNKLGNMRTLGQAL